MDPRTQARMQARSRQKIRERQVLYTAAAMLLMLTVSFFFPRKGVLNAAQLDQPTAQEMSRAPQPVTPQGATPVPTQTAMSIVPLNEITPDMVTEVRGGNIPTIEFRDGTKRSLAPSEVEQLPGEIRIRLEYSRD